MTKDEVLAEALECMEAAIKSGDWKVDGVCDPTMTIERMKHALEAKDEPVGEVLNERGEVDYISYVPPVGTALYTTPPKQEAKDEPVPVAIVEVFGKDWRLDYMALPVGKHKLYAQQYTYTTPPQRTWVGLTDEERSRIWGELPQTLNPERDACVFAETIEVYLKEKNS